MFTCVFIDHVFFFFFLTFYIRERDLLSLLNTEQTQIRQFLQELHDQGRLFFAYENMIRYDRILVDLGQVISCTIYNSIYTERNFQTATRYFLIYLNIYNTYVATIYTQYGKIN